MTNQGKRDLRIFDTSHDLTQAAAELIIQQATINHRSRENFTWVLAGGTTPKGLYELLAGPEYRDQLPWKTIQIFWGDERHVPPSHRDSNYNMAKGALLSKVQIPESNIHRIQGELSDAEEAARQYEAVLHRALGTKPPAIPRFDLILLGMGPDGHTASLFPDTSAIHESQRLVVAPWVEKFQAFRISLTPPIINSAAQIIFLVSGKEKAETLQAVLEGPFAPDRFPSQMVRPVKGQLIWLVDQQAGMHLKRDAF